MSEDVDHPSESAGLLGSTGDTTLSENHVLPRRTTISLKPLMTKALRYRDSVHPRKSGRPFPVCSTPTKDFDLFGVGVSLYFHHLRDLSIMFFVLFLLYVPVLVMIVLANPSIDFTSSDFFFFLLSSTAIPRLFSFSTNFGDALGNSTILPICDCQSRFDQAGNNCPSFCLPNGTFSGITADVAGELGGIAGYAYNSCGDICVTFNPGVLSLVVVFYDIVICMVLLWMANRFSSKIKATKERVYERSLLIKDYSVKVSRLPPLVNVDDLVDFIQKYVGKVIKQSIALNWGNKIELLRRRAKAKREFDRLKRTEEILEVEGRKSEHDEALKAEVIKARDRLQQITKEVADKKEDTSVVALFLTFDKEVSAKECIRLFRTSWATCMYMPKARRYKGRTLKVKKAPDPTDILWENLEVPKWERMLRRLLTFVVALFMIVFSFLLVIVIVNVRRSLSFTAEACYSASFTSPAASFPANDSCSTDAFGSNNRGQHVYPCPGLWLEEAGEIVLAGPFTNCSSPSSSCAFNSVVEKVLSLPSSGDCGGCSIQPDPCSSSLGSNGSTVHCVSPTVDLCRLCSCQALFDTSLSAFLAYSTCSESNVDGNEQAYCTFCQPFIEALLTEYGYRIVTIIAVVLINFLLKLAIRGLSRFEKHTSVTEREKTIALRLFFSQFLNTAVLLIIVYGSIPDIEKSVPIVLKAICQSTKSASLSVFTQFARSYLYRFIPLSGDFADISEGWLDEVQSSLVIALVTNIAIPLIPMVVHWPLSVIKRKKKVARVVLQEDLNELFEGGLFFLSERYGIALMTLFAILLFAPVNPGLYLLGSVIFVVYGWVDRVLVLRFYRTPQQFDESVGSLLHQLMPYSILLHMLFSSWIFSSVLPTVPLPASIGLYINRLEDLLFCNGTVRYVPTYSGSLLFNNTPHCDGQLSTPEFVSHYSIFDRLSSWNALILLLLCALFLASFLVRSCLTTFVFPFVSLCAKVGKKDVGSGMSFSLALANRKVAGVDSYDLQKQTAYKKEVGNMEAFFVQAGEVHTQDTENRGKTTSNKRGSVLSAVRSRPTQFSKGAGKVKEKRGSSARSLVNARSVLASRQRGMTGMDEDTFDQVRNPLFKGSRSSTTASREKKEQIEVEMKAVV